MVPHVVRHKREEMGLLVILPGPVVMATSTTILRGVGRVLLDLPMMAVFSVASFGFTRIGEEERRDGEAIALHKTHIWANSLKPVCFLCFLLIWCPLLPFIETGTLKIYTKMVLYMKNELLTSNTPHGV